MSVAPNQKEEYEQLCRTIQNWNENRLELFEISQPKENLEFEGVMRFYFQSSESDGQKVATKCIRVSSTSTTAQVVEALVQKFRPDLRMLTTPSLYTLYEVHADGEERMLDKNEHPLWVQLNWVEGNREGRFLLKKMLSSTNFFKSKKDKKNKEEKKKSKNKQKVESTKSENPSDQEQGSIARSLYTDMPESRLTRSVSIKQGNVRMLQHPGASNNGVQVHVSNDLLLPDTPYKSLLIGDKDTAIQVVRSAVEKYDIRDDPSKYCLVQVTVPNIPLLLDSVGEQEDVQVTERVLEDGDLPLLIHSRWAAANEGVGGALQFQLRRRASFNQNNFPDRPASAGCGLAPADLSNYPILVEVIQGALGSQSNPRTFPLTTAQSEIGSDPRRCALCLTSAGIRPRHCMITSQEGGTFTITPLDKGATILVNNRMIRASSALPNSALLKLGDADTFQFLAPSSSSSSSSSASNKQGSRVPPNTQEVRRNSRQSQQGTPNMSKAFSSEDILNPSSSSGSLKRPLKERAFSEFNLPRDGSPDEQKNTPESDTPAVESKVGSISSRNVQEWSVLPAALFFYHAKGSLLLQSLILDVEGYTLQFKLGPAFALYMMARCYLAPDFQPGVSTAECKKNLVLTLKNIATNIKRAIKDNRNIAGPLAFWLANTSELLHFLKSDHQLSLLSHEYNNQLTQLVRMSFSHFTEYMLRELNVTIPAFLDESPDADAEDTYLMAGGDGGDAKEPDVVPAADQPHLFAQTAIYWSVSESRMRRRGRATMGDVLFTLNSTMALLQSCKVNPTLCVLISSTLFHYISTRLFNKIVFEPSKYCSTNVGMRLGKRIERIIVWAETQGMELPAQEHLAVILQAASLLRSPKDNSQDAEKIFLTCAHLNSVQMRTLLEHSRANEGESVVGGAIVDKLVALAMQHTDKQLQADDVPIHLEEDINLELPFHVPEERYYCDGLVGVPPGLQEYLESAVSRGFCRLNINGEASGSSWITPLSSGSCHSLEMHGENVHSATLPRSLGHSQKSEDTLDPTITIRGFSTLPRQPPRDSRIVQLTITKEDTSNILGISITGGKGSTFGDVGIFIKSLTVGGAAEVDGRLSSGDQIIMVDGQSLEGASQQEAAYVLRSTGKSITLTVAKHAAHYLGLQALINHSSSPRNSRQSANVPEGTSHAQKAKRRQQRERERSQQSGGDPRLDSRKGDDIPEKSMAPHNSQFVGVAKWISEQRDLLSSRSEDHRSSTSTLSNIPELERPVSPDPSSSSSVTRLGPGERRSHPIRDSGLTRPQDSDSSTFSSLVHLEAPPTEASSRYYDYSQELDYHRPQTHVVGSGGNGVSQSLPHHNYSDTFNLSSQSAVQSQSFPAVMSQQRPTAGDRLSMDVLQHTQPSSASLSGVGAVLAKVKASSAVTGGGAGSTHFLLSSDLKGLDMDDVELEKQRIHFLLYEEQNEKELQSSASKEKGSMLKESTDETSEEELQLKKELLKIDALISEQKKKFKDLKYNREREEKRLKETEKQLQKTIAEAALLTGDQHRQLEQRKRQQELDQRKHEHSRRIRGLTEDEHSAKTKLQALECNAKATREQLQQFAKSSRDGGGDLGPQKMSSNGMMAHGQQEDDFSEKGSDVPRPGSPSVVRESVQLRLPEPETSAERQWVNQQSWSHHSPTAVNAPGLPRDVGSARMGKTMSATGLSELSEDGDQQPAKWSGAYDGAHLNPPPHASERYNYRSHSRDDIDDMRKGPALERSRNGSVEGMLAPAGAGERKVPASPQQELKSRREGRHSGRGRDPYEAAVVGRDGSSSAWYQSSAPQPYGFQRPSSADSRSDSPSAYNRPDQGPPSTYNRPEQGPPSTYSRPDLGPSGAYNRFDQGLPGGAYNRGVAAGRYDQQAPGGPQNRGGPSPVNFPTRTDQGSTGMNSRPGSAFSDSRSDFEPSRGPQAANGRPDANGRLDHHYSRQTKPRIASRSLNQSSSADNLIATAEAVGDGGSRQPVTPDVVPSTRGERSAALAGRIPAESQPASAVLASRERDVVLSSGNISSPRTLHSRQEPDFPLAGERTRAMTFSGAGAPAPRHAQPPLSHEQTSPQQQCRVMPRGYPYEQAAAPHVRSHEQPPSLKPHENVRSYSSGQGKPYEQVVMQQGQQGRAYGLQGQIREQSGLQQQQQQGRSYEQVPAPQGRSYNQPPVTLQGRPYEQVTLAQGKSHDHVPMPPQGRSNDPVPVSQRRSHEQVSIAQVRPHDALTMPQGRSYDPVSATQRRAYEQFALPQGKPQEQSRALLGRPYEPVTLPSSGHLQQGQRTSPHERMLMVGGGGGGGGDQSNVGRNPVGYSTKAGSHSYSRRRPDPPQQLMMTLEDKMKHYIEGMEEPSYPDRIQRQQTEL